MSIETIIPGKKYLIITWPQGGRGKRKKETFYGDHAQAVKHHAELCRMPHLQSVTNPRIRQLWPDFLTYYKNERLPSTVDSVALTYDAHLLPFFGDRPVSQLTPTIIEQYKAQRLSDGVKKRTIDKELSYLGSLIKWGVEMGHCNPLLFKIKRFPAKQTKAPIPRVPTQEEVQAIYDSIKGDRKKGLFLLMYDGGLRKTEASTIKAEDIDLGNDLMLVTGKGGKQRVVPIMSQRLKEELTHRVNKTGEGYLYINPATDRPYTSIRLAIKEAAIRAGVDKDIYNHILRHAFGTHAIEAGVNIKALQGMMGHSTVKVTEIYTHIGGSFVKKEGEKIRNARRQSGIKSKEKPSQAKRQQKLAA